MTANTGGAAGSSEAHDAWFRSRMLQARDDPRPDAEVEAHFAKRRATVLHAAPTGK